MVEYLLAVHNSYKPQYLRKLKRHAFVNGVDLICVSTHQNFVSPKPDEVRKWLTVFVTRFFGNQFKRSCLPDGPKVGSVSLSPRGDWRMPSDAHARLWLDRLSQ